MSKTSNTGVSATGLLQVAFIVLKLAGIGAVAAWSWWWVLSPTWISISLALLIIGGLLLYHRKEVFGGKRYKG